MWAFCVYLCYCPRVDNCFGFVCYLLELSCAWILFCLGLFGWLLVCLGCVLVSNCWAKAIGICYRFWCWYVLQWVCAGCNWYGCVAWFLLRDVRLFVLFEGLWCCWLYCDIARFYVSELWLNWWELGLWCQLFIFRSRFVCSTLLVCRILLCGWGCICCWRVAYYCLVKFVLCRAVYRLFVMVLWAGLWLLFCSKEVGKSLMVWALFFFGPGWVFCCVAMLLNIGLILS